MKPKKTKFFSVRDGKFGDFLMLGVGVGWDKSDPSMGLMLVIGKWVVMIGPHYPIN